MAFDRFARTCAWNFFNQANPLLALSQRFSSGREPVVSESWSERTCSFKNVNPTTDCRPIEAELAGHGHKLDVTLQSFVVVAFRWLLCTCLSSLTTLEWIDQQNLRKQKWGAFFTLKFKCHNWYNKLLLCNYKNGDIAWCNKNNWGFCVFLEKRIKNCFLLEKTKNSGFPQPWFKLKTVVFCQCEVHVASNFFSSVQNCFRKL